jgi:hypothetical protein
VVIETDNESMLSFPRVCQAVFENGFVILHTNKQEREGLLFHIL